jgi:hypothetical protein
VIWVTRKHIRVNRAATTWLIKRFVDPEAVFMFLDPTEVAEFQRREGARGFDAPGATYPHRDVHGLCSFEALVQDHRPDDPAFPLVATDDHETVDRVGFLYDALYAALVERMERSSPAS